MIDKVCKLKMDQMIKTKAKTHRSCFRKVFTALVDVQEIEEKNAQQLIEDYSDIFNVCLSKCLLIY
jgi:methionyl-tRNA synthetase